MRFRGMVWGVVLAGGVAVSGVGAWAAANADALDVNQATMAQLMRVPGITEVWARRIVRFRPYRSKLDLLDKGVIPPRLYAQIRDEVVAHRVK